MGSFTDRMMGRSKIAAGRMSNNRRMERDGHNKNMLGKMKNAMTSRWR